MTTYVKITVTPSGGAETTVTDPRSPQLTRSIGDNNSSSRLTFRVHNHAGRNKSSFTAGEEITLYADKGTNPPTTKRFSGVITEISYDGSGVSEEIIITARDWTSYLQNTTVEPEVYTNQTISAIITDLMTKYGPTGITTTNVGTFTKTLSRIAFKQISLFDAIKKLANEADALFYVDPTKDLHVEVKGSTSSGVTLDNTNVTHSSFREDVQSVRNRVYVYGSRILVAHPQETFTGDGAGSVFTLDTNPHNTRVQVSGADKKGDIFKGAESATSGADYLVNYYDKKIIFLSGTALGYSSIPGSLVQVTVNYNQSKPIIKLAEDQLSIASYGRRTEVITDESIQDPQYASLLAKSTVASKKTPLLSGDIDVVGVVNVTPGQTIIVNLPHENQSNKTYDILEARYDFSTKNCLADTTLNVKVSERIADITDVIKDLVLSVRQLQAANIDTTGILSRLMVATGSYGLRASDWKVRTRTLGNAFTVGHETNGKIGSPAVAINGSQVFIGDYRSSLTIERSGGET